MNTPTNQGRVYAPERKTIYQDNTFLRLNKPHENGEGILLFGKKNKDPEKVREEVLRVLEQYATHIGHEEKGEKIEKPEFTGGVRRRRLLYRPTNEEVARFNGKGCRVTLSHLETKMYKYHDKAQIVRNIPGEPPIENQEVKFIMYFYAPWTANPEGNSIVSNSGHNNVLFEKAEWRKRKRYSQRIDVLAEESLRYRDGFLTHLEERKYGHL